MATSVLTGKDRRFYRIVDANVIGVVKPSSLPFDLPSPKRGEGKYCPLPFLK